MAHMSYLKKRKVYMISNTCLVICTWKSISALSSMFCIKYWMVLHSWYNMGKLWIKTDDNFIRSEKPFNGIKWCHVKKSKSNVIVSRHPAHQRRVGGVFMRHAPNLKELYTRYCANHPRSVAILQKNRYDGL